MSEPRLPAGLEAAAIRRLAEVAGGHAMVLHKGDADRGALVLMVSERGAHRSVLERILRPDGHYRWDERPTDHDTDSAEDVEKRQRDRLRFDPDLWLIELNVPDAERFIAEITTSG